MCGTSQLEGSLCIMIGVVIGNGSIYSIPYPTSPIGINLQHHTHYVDDNSDFEGFVGMCTVVVLSTVHAKNIVKFLKSCTTTPFMVFIGTCTICKGPKIDA